MKIRAMAFVASLGLLSSGGAAFSAELLATSSVQKSAGRIALDLVSDGEVSGFSFFVRTGGAKVDTSKCLAELPKGFSGGCQLGKDGVYVLAVADAMTTLPAGATTIGYLSMSGLEKRALSVSIEQLEMSDVRGDVVSATSQVAQ